MLEAGWTPGLQCGRKDYVDEELQWHQRESLAAQWLNQLRH